jgi:hypothetical protein
VGLPGKQREQRGVASGKLERKDSRARLGRTRISMRFLDVYGILS